MPLTLKADQFVRTGILWILAFCLIALTVSGENVPTPADSAFDRYSLARSNYLASVGNSTSAWKFARACFDWAEFATNDTQRATIAREGIAAAKFTAENAPDDPAGHFYLAINQGQLARTMLLGALSLVREMERSLLRSAKLDPKFNHAAAHRSLGMLYFEAPGWPASIGNRSKAREHFRMACSLAPDYPENHLAFLEASAESSNLEALRTGIEEYRKILPEAREKYSGSKWENDWKDWNKRWTAVLDRDERLRKTGR